MVTPEDVYKRQGLVRQQFQPGFHTVQVAMGIIKIHASKGHHALGGQKAGKVTVAPHTIEPPFGVSTFDGLHVPVSYTHLDVYKRQRGSRLA